MRRVLLVNAVVLLLAAIGGFISTSARYVAMTRALKAQPCSDSSGTDCWREVPATVDSVTSCSHDACTVTITAASVHASVRTDREAADALHSGASVTARLLDRRVLMLRTDAGVSVSAWDLLDQNRHNLAVVLVVFALLGVVGCIFFQRAHQMPGPTHAQPLSRAGLHRIANITVIVFGLITIGVFTSAWLAKRATTERYERAPECGEPAANCRLHTTAKGVSEFCHALYYPVWCEVTLRLSTSQPDAFVVANLLRPDALAIEHTPAKIEIFEHQVTRVDLGDRTVIPQGQFGSAVTELQYLAFFALALVAYGLFGLLRARRWERH
jgi:hypothetical protein